MPLAIQICLTIGVILFVIMVICAPLFYQNYEYWYSRWFLYNEKSGMVKIVLTVVGIVLFILWLVYVAVMFIWHLY